jgi:four helix bundle protein
VTDLTKTVVMNKIIQKQKSNELESRLIAFSVSIVALTDSIPGTPPGKYLSGQLVRSGISPALNYGEARSAESVGDFIHKMKIILKELRESFISLRILKKCKILSDERTVDECISECNELIAIFVTSVQTAEKSRKALLLKNRLID